MTIKKNFCKNLIAKTLVFSVLALSMFPNFKENTYAEETSKSINLTNLNYYNLIVLGNFDENGNPVQNDNTCNITNSKIEGALAVNGNINISNGKQGDWGNYGNPEVGAFLSQGADVDKNNMTEKDDYETSNTALLLGGKIIIDNCDKKLNAWSSNTFPIVAENNDFDSKLGILLNGQEKNHIAVKSKEEIDSAFKSLKSTSESFADECGSLSSLSPTETDFVYNYKNNNGKWFEGNKVRINSLNGSDDVLVINMPSQDDGSNFSISGGEFPSSINIGGQEKDLKDFKKVIIISNADNIHFNGGTWQYKGSSLQVQKNNETLLKELGSRVMWVFPNATKVEKDGLDIIGSLIAPRANFISHGSNNVGQVIVKTLNQNHGGEFYALAEYPSLEMKAQDKVILYGDKVNLSELIGSTSSTGAGTYNYVISKEGETNPIDEGKFVTSVINDKVEIKDTYVNPKDSGTYEIKITGNGINRMVKSKITVLKPQIKITKEVEGSNDKKIFSFNLIESYSLKSGDVGYVPVFLNNQEWNADVVANDCIGMMLNSISRGTYTFRERATGGYSLINSTLNGENFNINNSTFNIGLSKNNKVTLNGEELEGDNPVISIVITNIKKETDFFHSNDILRNLFRN